MKERTESLSSQVKRLLNENRKLREAVEWYGNRDNWRAKGHPQIDADTAPALMDGGSKARFVMEQLR